MPSDEPDDRKLDLGEELELSSDDDAEERLRQKRLASIPGPAKQSRVVRKVILGRGITPASGDQEVPPPRRARQSRREDPLPQAPEPPKRSPEPGAFAKQDQPVAEGDLAAPPAPAPEPVAEPEEVQDLGWDEPKDNQLRQPSSSAPPRRRRRYSKGNAEAEWTGSRGTLWWVLAGLGCLTLIGFFLRQELIQGGSKTPASAPYRPPVSAGIEASPIASFVKHSAEILPVLVERVALAESPEGRTRADLYRRGAESLARMDEWYQRVPPYSAFNADAYQDLHASAVRNTGYLSLEGWRAGYTRALIFFVERENDYLLDWEATVGYSEVLPEECGALPDEKPRLMRCIVGLSLYYTDLYPEERFACYALHHRDLSTYVWAYVPRASREASAMAGHISHNLKRPLAGRATVMVRRGRPGARPRQVEIAEFLYPGWVGPDGVGTDEPGSGLEKAGGE